MRTSLSEIRELEQLLLKEGRQEDRLLIEARILSSPKWAEDAFWQSRSYDLINSYGREKLREEIKAVEHQIFHTAPHRSFQARIRSIFKL